MSKNKIMKVSVEALEEAGALVSWDEQERKSAYYINRFHKKQNRDVHIDFKGPFVLLCFVADIHIGNLGTDYTAARLQAEQIAGCRYAFAVGAGDYIDNFIRAQILEPLINQTTSPKQQLQLLREYISFFAGKLMLMVSGNHDRWSKEVSGLDFLASLAKDNLIQYSPDTFDINIYVGKILYELCVRHRYRFNSSFNLTHTVKQLFKNGEKQFDIGVVAHLHEPALETCYIQDREVVCVRPGTYKTADTFSRKIGYNAGRTVMPCVALDTSKKRMVPFFHLEDGIRFVKEANR